MLDKVKIAAVQMNPKLMRKDENLETIVRAVRRAVDNEVNLIAFPECSLTGYIFASPEEALPFAETIPGPSTEKLISLCQELKVYVVFGLLEKEGEKIFNAVSFVGPQGLIGSHRKNHIPLPENRFINTGDKPFQVYRTPIGNMGLLICYDVFFPESARVMTLLGADILIWSASWPQGSGQLINSVVRTRAIENRVHIVSSCRFGSEKGFTFAGLSNIVNHRGEVLSLASRDKEEIIYAEVSPTAARQKHLFFISDKYQTDFIKDRRPEFYGVITNYTA